MAVVKKKKAKKRTIKKTDTGTKRSGPGRPTVFNNENRKEILTVLAFGGSRNDAADFVRVSRGALSAEVGRNEEFAEQVCMAEVQGKIKHLERISNATAWQASAWFLERKYPNEYATKQRHEIVGKDGQPLNLTSLDVSGLPTDVLSAIMAAKDAASKTH